MNKWTNKYTYVQGQCSSKPRFWDQTTWSLIPSSILTSQVTLDKLLKLSLEFSDSPLITCCNTTIQDTTEHIPTHTQSVSQCLTQVSVLKCKSLCPTHTEAKQYQNGRVWGPGPGYKEGSLHGPVILPRRIRPAPVLVLPPARRPGWRRVVNCQHPQGQAPRPCPAAITGGARCPGPSQHLRLFIWTGENPLYRTNRNTRCSKYYSG